MALQSKDIFTVPKAGISGQFRMLAKSFPASIAGHICSMSLRNARDAAARGIMLRHVRADIMKKSLEMLNKSVMCRV